MSAEVIPMLRPGFGETKGRILSSEDIAKRWPEECRPSTRWVSENVPGKHRSGGKPWWWEQDVDDWFAEQEPET